jgi:hypothetical protein
MIRARLENQKLAVEISGKFTDVREEMLQIGEAVRRIPDRKRRDELALAFTMGAFGDPDVLKDKPDLDELIHSDKEGEE